MTTQGEFTGEILRSGADLLRNAEFAIMQVQAGVGMVAGERALAGTMDDEQRAAMNDFLAAYGSLTDRVLSSNGDFAAHLPDAQLPLDGGESEGGQAIEAPATPELETGEVADSGEQPDQGVSEAADPAGEDEQAGESDEPGEPEAAADDEPSDPETEEVHEGRYRQEAVLVELFGGQHEAEIARLPYEKIQNLGKVAAAFYGRMELHSRAEPTRDERVDMINRYVAKGESSADIARDYGQSNGAPRNSIFKAVEIMVRDLDADAIQRAYESVVNS